MLSLIPRAGYGLGCLQVLGSCSPPAGPQEVNRIAFKDKKDQVLNNNYYPGTFLGKVSESQYRHVACCDLC